MKQGRRSHYAGENTFNGFDADIRLGQTQPTVREHQAYIDAYECATAPEDKTHKPADRAIALDPFTVVNPDKRKVLHVVKHFEQCDADKNAGYDIVAVPPKGNARDKKDELNRTRPLPLYPHPDEVHEEYT